MRILALLLLYPCLLFAQQPINSDQFFSMGMAERMAASNKSGETIKFPWIEEYELRTETRDFDFEQQEYTLRFSPSSSKRRKAQKALYDHLHAQPDVDRQKAYCDQLSTVHTDWLNTYIITNNLNLLQQLTKVVADKQTVYAKMAGAYDIDFQKLVKLQVDKSELAIAINDLEADNSYISRKYGIEGRPLDFNDFITIAHITDFINLDDPAALNRPDAQAAYDKELISKELALEMAENKQLLDFAQLKYQGPHSDMVKERVSVGIGIRFPNSGDKKLKIKELQLKQEDIQLEEQRETLEMQQLVAELKQRLIKKIGTLAFYQKTIEEERRQLQNMGAQIVKKEGFSPMVLLDIEERHISTQLKILGMQEDIFSDFLRYVEESGRMCEEPFVNYLTKN